MTPIDPLEPGEGLDVRQRLHPRLHIIAEPKLNSTEDLPLRGKVVFIRGYEVMKE